METVSNSGEIGAVIVAATATTSSDGCGRSDGGTLLTTADAAAARRRRRRASVVTVARVAMLPKPELLRMQAEIVQLVVRRRERPLLVGGGKLRAVVYQWSSGWRARWRAYMGWCGRILRRCHFCYPRAKVYEPSACSNKTLSPLYDSGGSI